VGAAVKVLSLGAGVQSSALLLMAVHGELDIDAAIFADTGWEPAGVYTWLEQLRAESIAAGIPLYTVDDGNIREKTLSPGQYASLPLYVRQPNGKLGMGRRQCTKEYKLRPIQRKLRELGGTAKRPIDMMVGISLDEYQRVADSRVKYVHNVFPLIDLRMTRTDCINWLQRHGYPEPMKSACIGCPYRKNSEWRKLTIEEMADAVDFDQQIRHHNKTMTGEQFVHRSFTPLELVDFRTQADRGQLDMLNQLDAAEDFDGCGVLCPADDAT
jgi:hypothetical protein